MKNDGNERGGSKLMFTAAETIEEMFKFEFYIILNENPLYIYFFKIKTIIEKY